MDAFWWSGTAALTLNTPSQLPTTPVTGFITTNTASSTINSGKNQTAAITIFSPLMSDGYTGPTAIKVYRDNVYGTFMFYGAD